MSNVEKFGGISSFSLHMLAMLFMLCDHVWATLVPGNRWLTCIGRIAFPIFAFLLAEGFYYTRDRKKYFLRLLAAALISEVPFNLMYDGGLFYPYHQNVIWTLLIAFACMAAMEKLRSRGKWWLAAIGSAAVALGGWLLGTLAMADYYGTGVLMVLVFYLFRGRKWWQLAGQALGLFWINWILLGGLCIPVRIAGYDFDFPQQGFALLALLFIWLYRGRKGFRNRAVQTAFYAFYPLHMLILALLGKLWA